MNIDTNMLNFITKYWPKDAPYTANDPLWIIAGNRTEFEDFVIRKRVQGLFFDYRYVSSADTIRGLNRIRGLYVGSYQERNDLAEIQQYIAIIRTKNG